MRQVLVAAWAYANIFGGIPSLLVTPIYVAANPRHRLWYDSLLRLKTDPAEGFVLRAKGSRPEAMAQAAA